MAKIYAIYQEEADYSGCWYEGDHPYITKEIVKFSSNKQNVEDIRRSLVKKYLDTKSRRLLQYSVEELDIPKPIITYLWDHRDD